jgi:hypothetical protein
MRCITMSKFIIFWPQTGVCRVFDSYNLAEATYPKQPIIQQGGVLAAFQKFKKANPKIDKTIHDWYEELFHWVDAAGYLTHDGSRNVKAPNGTVHKKPKWHDDDDEQTMAEAFWRLAINAGNMVRTMPAAASEKKRGRPSGYSIDLVQANVQLMALQTREVKAPSQVKQMIEFFTAQEFDYYTLPEMQKICNSSAFYQTVKTTQDGWRIFRYYTPMLKEMGVLK